MNRLFHVRETLPVNIRENISFPNIEFILLDYNSSDGLEDWVRSNMMDYIESGILKFYRTPEPVYFNICHSKNIAAKLSTGDILCMIDADNYAGCDYARWIDSVFPGDNKNILVTTIQNLYGDIGGKISFHRDLFNGVRGFDEAMAGYGMDDVDLISRLEKAGGSKIYIRNEEYMRFIRHSTKDRLSNYYMMKNLEDIYIKITGSMKTENTILYFLKDNTYHEITYKYDEKNVANTALTLWGWHCEKDGYRQGTFERLTDGYFLCDKKNKLYRQAPAPSLVSYSGNVRYVWEKIMDDDPLYFNFLMAHNDCLNRIKYLENNELRQPVNLHGWGKGTVYRNFNNDIPIHM